MARRLLTNEQEVWPPIRRHWIVLARDLVPAGVAALVLVLAIDLPGGTLLSVEARLVLTMVVLVMLGLWVLWVYLNWRAASLTLTDQRVILEEGVVTRTSKVIPLDRVQDVSTKQSLLGRLLNYGEIEIDTAGTVANEVVPYLRAPESLRDQVYVLSEQVRRGG